MELAAVITGSAGALASIVTLVTLWIRGVFTIERRLTELILGNYPLTTSKEYGILKVRYAKRLYDGSAKVYHTGL
jgi:hypothetical protein